MKRAHLFLLFVVLLTFPMIQNCGKDNNEKVDVVPGIRAFAVNGTELKEASVYPQPTVTETTIRALFTGPEADDAEAHVKIYDVSGQKLRELNLANDGTGDCRVKWDLMDSTERLVANGAYVAEITVSLNGVSGTQRHKLVVAR